LKINDLNTDTNPSPRFASPSSLIVYSPRKKVRRDEIDKVAVSTG
jgi:hypothetical protein